MVAIAPRNWLTLVLGLMPTRLHKALDAWSYRIAQKRAKERRLADRPHAAAEPIDYEVRPWRD